MLRQVWARLFPKSPTATRLACDAEVSGDAVASTGYEYEFATKLMALCDSYWDSFANPRVGSSRPPYAQYVNAVNELARRGREIMPWARARLKHPEYDAREQAAFLLGELAQRGQLQDELAGVVAELSELAIRPVQEDGKEAQANTAAVVALAKTGDRRAIAPFRHILTSAAWEADDLAWEAACALGSLVKEPFAQAGNPVRAAREWLQRTGNE
jgi:hypothetical protein